MSERSVRDWLRAALEEEASSEPRRPISQVMIAAKPEQRAFESIEDAVRAISEVGLVWDRTARSLEAVAAIGSSFAATLEVKALTLHLSGVPREQALAILAELEVEPGNRSIWVVLEEAHTHADTGWERRADRVLAHWDQRRADSGVELPEAMLPQPSLRSRWWGRQATVEPFRDACVGVLRAEIPPLDGWVLVIAPSIVDEPDVLRREINGLQDDPALRKCRWIVVLES
jgi:hypothetical protein